VSDESVQRKELSSFLTLLEVFITFKLRNTPWISPLSIVMVLCKQMVKYIWLFTLLGALLVTGCTAEAQPDFTEGPSATAIPAATEIPTSTSVVEQTSSDTDVPAATNAAEQSEAVCPGEKVNSIGQGIADEYQFTDYDEVMRWFCQGAEFEDILLALQSEDQSDFPAEEMLAMLAEGLSWEDIWQVIGLVE
jgi:hypothetical protein